MKSYLLPLLFLLFLSACAGGTLPDDRTEQEKRAEKFGKLFGDELLVFGQSNDPQDEKSFIGNNISRVSPLLWLASLKVVGDMPLLQADRVNGIILSDWYQLPNFPQEQFKIDITINSSVLRSDGISVRLFRQVKKNNEWQHDIVSPKIVTAIEDTILNEARKLKAQSP